MAKHGCLATYGGVTYWSSVQDLFSDVLSTRPGQLVFFNLTKTEPLSGHDLDVKSEFLEPTNAFSFCGGTDERGKYGYTGIYRITGRPRFDPHELTGDDENATLESDYAIRVPIEPVRIYADVYPEWKLLDVQDTTSDVWQPRFRKFLQSAKSLASMTPWETQRLIRMLDDGPHSWIDGDDIETSPRREGAVISMTDLLNQTSDGRQSTVPDGGLSAISLDDIIVKDGDQFKYEKGLEAWWVENFDSGREVFEALLAAGDLIWFSNYIPATSSGTALDGLALLEKPNGKYRAIPVEMKRGNVKETPGRREVEQLYRYSVWAKEFLGNKVDTAVEDVRPVYLAAGMNRSASAKAPDLLTSESYFVDPTFVEYTLERDGVHLNSTIIR